MNNSLVNILIEARDSLTTETWRKGNYFHITNYNYFLFQVKRFFFQPKNNTIRMCAHGAVQKIVNPKVQVYLKKYDIFMAKRAVVIPIPEVILYAVSEVKLNLDKSLLQIWNERPDWVKKDSDYGSGDAHYFLGMVGLTISFNDDPNTTLEMVKDKFNEAIELAKLIENQNNG